MQSGKKRGDFAKLIATRYGFGYVRTNNTQVFYLMSPYLPNHPEGLKEKIECPAFIDSKFRFREELGAVEKYLPVDDNFNKTPAYLRCTFCEDEINDERIPLVLAELDQKHKPIELKQDQENVGKAEALFNQYRVGIKEPIQDNKVLWGSFLSGNDLDSNSEYSLVLDFPSGTCMQRFLCGIPEYEQAKADAALYATYECNYGAGCYQILVPKGNECQAFSLLFGCNVFTMDFPGTQFLIQKLQPVTEPFLTQSPRPSFNDQQYSAVFAIIKNALQGKCLLSHFEDDIQKVIKASPSLVNVLQETDRYFQSNSDTINFLNTLLPAAVTTLVMDYYREPPKGMRNTSH